MQKPGYFAIATAVFTAGIGNAFIYVLGYVTMVAIQFLTKDAGGASIASALSAFIIALMFTLALVVDNHFPAGLSHRRGLPAVRPHR